MLDTRSEILHSSPVLTRLEGIADQRSLPTLAAQFAELQQLLQVDLQTVDALLQEVPDTRRRLERSAAHIIASGGKRIRPVCVLLAARLGTGFTDSVAQLAAAVELVHCATLLHDDVVDMADLRRGLPAARTVYGNAASIFAGDWLLIEALRRVRSTGRMDLLDQLLAVIDTMIQAEAIQLEQRGRMPATADIYWSIIDGKTSALFRWALSAGGHIGGLSDAHCRALETFGGQLGAAFQVVDDLLDVAGDPLETGKSLLTDLKEGKTTYPLIVALERNPDTLPLVEQWLSSGAQGDQPDDALLLALQRILSQPDIQEQCRAVARHYAVASCATLEALPDVPARHALMELTRKLVSRAF